MRSNVLRRFDFTQQVRRITADTFSGNFDRDDTLRVNDEGSAVSQTFIFTHVVEVTGQGASRVADHRIFDFGDGFRAAVPRFVGEVGIGRVNVYAQLLQFFVMVSHVAQFGRADEGEVSRIEEEDAPAAFGVFLGDFDEFTILNAVLNGLILVLIKDIYTSSVFSLRSKLTNFPDPTNAFTLSNQ